MSDNYRSPKNSMGLLSLTNIQAKQIRISLANLNTSKDIFSEKPLEISLLIDRFVIQTEVLASFSPLRIYVTGLC